MSTIRRTCRTLAEGLGEHPITFPRIPLIDRHSKVLTLGSCFALRVKEFLLANRYCVLNEGDLRPWVVDGRTEWDPRIYYNTFTIRQEFERIAGAFVQNEDDIWEPRQTQAGRFFQDPYRRMLCGTDRADLWSRIHDVDRQMQKHVQEADLVVITLGLTEVFFQKSNGRAIAAVPGYAGGGGLDAEFRATEYPENFDNIDTIIRILKEINPRAHLVLTVSPVPLGATFTASDHLVANTESKSTLRAAAGALVRRYGHVHYFHSFELVMGTPREQVFLEDGRHVAPAYVPNVMAEFEKAFVKEPVAALTQSL